MSNRGARLDLGLVAVVVAGALSAAIYTALTVRMSLQEFFPGPGYTIDFKDMLGPGWRENWWLLWSAFAALFLLWGVALSRVSGARDRTVRVVAFGVPVVFVAVLASMYPPFAVDHLHNLGDARTLWIYGENPLTTGPGAHFPIAQSFGDSPAPYGPLWFILAGPPALLGEIGGTHYVLSLILLKVWMGVFYLVAAALVWRIAGRLAPGREAFAVVLFAWNPFVVWRVLGNGHNDIVMMTFLLAAVLASLERRWFWVPVALAASVLVKYVTLLTVPAFAVAILRLPREERGSALRQAAVGSAVSLVLTVALFAPFWEGLDTFDEVREQAGNVITSTPLLLEYAANRWFDVDPERAHDVVPSLAALAFVAAAGHLLFRQRDGAVSLIATAASVMLLYTLIAVGWFRPWYFLWIVIPAALLPGRRWVVLCIVTSVAGLTPDVIEQYRNNVGWLPGHEFWLLAAPIVPAFVPPALAWLAAYLRSGHQDFDASGRLSAVSVDCRTEPVGGESITSR